MIKSHFAEDNWALAYVSVDLVAEKWHGILRESAMLEYFG